MDEHVGKGDLELTAPLQRGSRDAVTRRSWVRGAIVLGVLLPIGVLPGSLWTRHQGLPQSGAGHRGEEQTTVGAATIETGDVRIVLNALGTATSLNTVTVLSQISGRLIEVGFKEGQQVKKGDFLAQIDPRPYQAALNQVEGTLAHDQALLEQAQTNLKRYQTLGRQNYIPKQQADDQGYLVEQYIGTVRTDQANVDNAKLNLDYCRILSPIDGQVGLRLIDPGNYVSAGDATGIITITQIQPISVLFSVPEDSLPDIISRTRAGAVLIVEAYDRANKRLLASGQLATVDNQIDTTTGTVKLRALFANREELLYPNQFVNVHLLIDTIQGTIRVPVDAVQRGEPGTYVYVIGDNNKVAVRPVKLGPSDNGFTAVLSGLQSDEKVVTEGVDRLRDGIAVTILTSGQTVAQGLGREHRPRDQDPQPAQPDLPRSLGHAAQSGRPPEEATQAFNPALQPDALQRHRSPQQTQ
jgi:multidrug efflux system membrane fusion protein